MDGTINRSCKPVPDSPIRLGIVGCGVALRHHMPGIQEIPDVKIVALCDLDTPKAVAVARQFKIQNTYTEFEDLLKKEAPHAVHILTPPDTHASLAITAMEGGCHVLVEKPMALSVAEVDSMITVGHRNEVQLCIMHNHLFDPPIMKAREMLREGTIGDLLQMEVKYCLDTAKMREEDLIAPEHWAHRLPLRIFGEYTPHLVYLLLSILGEVHSVKVSARRTNGQTPEAVGGLNVTLTSDSCTGHLSMLTNTTYGHFTVHLYGSKAVLHINMLDLTMTVEREYPFPRPIANMLGTVVQSVRNISMTTGNLAKIATGRLKRRPGHRMLIKQFYQSLRQGSTPPVTGEHGREVVRILEMVKDNWPSQSGPTGGTESVSDKSSI